MSWYVRWRNVFRSGRLNDELDTEFQFHLAETVDRLVRDGMPEEEALRQARLRLGNCGVQKQRTRDMDVAALRHSRETTRVCSPKLTHYMRQKQRDDARCAFQAQTVLLAGKSWPYNASP